MLEGLEIAQQEVGLTEVSCNTKRERQIKYQRGEKLLYRETKTVAACRDKGHTSVCVNEVVLGVREVELDQPLLPQLPQLLGDGLGCCSRCTHCQLRLDSLLDKDCSEQKLPNVRGDQGLHTAKVADLQGDARLGSSHLHGGNGLHSLLAPNLQQRKKAHGVLPEVLLQVETRTGVEKNM